MVDFSEFISASWQISGTKNIDFQSINKLNDDAFKKVHLQIMKEYEDILWKGDKYPKCSCCGEKIDNYTDLSRLFGVCYHPRCLRSVIDSIENLGTFHKKYLERVYTILGLGQGEFQLEFEL